MSVNISARTWGIIGIISLSFSNMRVCCVFSLELPDRGDSNEFTQYTIFNIKKEICIYGIFQRDSRTSSKQRL